MKILFVEPPKDPWFIMGEYIPPPLGLLCLAGYLEAHYPDAEIQVMDCQAEEAKWEDVTKRIETFQPDLVAPSTVSTCNANITIQAITLAKQINEEIWTVAGGKHFSALAQGSLDAFPQLDFIIRGEGEVTLVELIRALKSESPLSQVKGLSFRQRGKSLIT